MISKKYLHFVLFGTLTLLVMLPLLKPGFVLTLDMVFTPSMSLPAAITPSYPFYAVLHALSLVLPVHFLQKIILLCILFFSGVGAYGLAKLLLKHEKPEEIEWAAYGAGTLYMFNPFVYSRFMAGQFAVLLGYMLIPFFAVSLWRFFGRPAFRGALNVSLLLVAIAILSIHTLGMAFIVGFVFLAHALIKNDSPQWRRLAFTWLLVVGGIFTVLCSYWIVPTILGKGGLSEIVQNFGTQDTKAFATSSDGLGIIGNVMSLQGFWADTKNLYIVPHDVFSWWWAPTISIWAILLVGIFVALKRQRHIAVTMLVLAFTGMVLAVGTAGTWFRPINDWLLGSVPFFSGYREPQKFVVLIALAYTYFFAYSILAIKKWISSKPKIAQHSQLIAGVIIALPILWSPLMIWGFRGQLTSSEYPVEWFAVSDRLTAECRGNCKILYLPWHMYMRYDFAGRIIANPAPSFFGPRIIASNDPEFAGASSYYASSDQKFIQDSFLPSAPRKEALGKVLAAKNIDFVLLARENDYKKYDYLNKQKDIKAVLTTPSLVLYEVKK